MPTYEYNIFISYNHADKPWAKRLFDSLKARGLRVFWDKDSLAAGVPWENVLVKALPESQHLVALWSESKESNWVTREVAKFEGITNPSGDLPINPERRLIFVNLQGRNTAYSSTQSINDLV